MRDGSIPSIFVSHGAPTTPLEDIPARAFLKDLGAKYDHVRFVLCVSAHWETERAAVTAVERPGTIHDFYGFPDELYRIRYSAKGAPDLARKVAVIMTNAGLDCDLDVERGLDHGAWVPLMLMFPRANVPVVQLSIQHHLDPAHHLEVGKVLSGLREEGAMILGSGGAVHPLGYADLWEGKPTDPWAIAFDDWLTGSVTRGDGASLVNYRKVAPYPERAHPRPDHYMPILSAMGAGGKGAAGKVIHHSWYYGDLGMAAYAFGT
jgi:4,5-DOPA dioxygenase extradiol